MASKYDMITQLYESTIFSVAKNPDNWMSFLAEVSPHYKYQFDEQILIYAQRPDARACADIDTWNKKVGRWVNRGAKGIALFNEDNSFMKLKYVFDVSDTHDRYGRNLKLWQVEEKYNEEIIESLESRFGELENKETLEQAIISATSNAVEDNIQDYLESLIDSKSDSFLEELDDLNIEVKLRRLLTYSIASMVMFRCDKNPFEYFEQSDFRDIVDFNTHDTITVLGTATSDIAESTLREIQKTIRNLQIEEKKQNRTFEQEENKVYDSHENKTKENIERSVENENSIHNARGLQSTELTNTRTERNDNGEIRKNEANILEGTQEGTIQDNVHEEQIARPLDGNRENSQSENGTDNRGNEENREYNRRIESTRPDEVGTNDEQLEADSRGNSDERVDLQLGIYVKDSNRSCPYVVTDSKINQLLSITPHLRVSNSEIIQYFDNEKDTVKRAEFLKNIFNIDYTELAINDERYGYKAFENGLLTWKGSYLSRDAETLTTWKELIEHYEAMIMLHQLKDNNPRLPSVTDQISLTEQVEERPELEFTQEFIDRVLQERGTFSKYAIYKQFQSNLSLKDNADYLKKMYGQSYYGTSGTVKGSGIGLQCSPKGMTLNRGYLKNSIETTISWNNIAKRINELITLNRYLNDKELSEYPNWLKEQEEKKQINVAKERLADTTPVVESEDDKLAKRVQKFIDVSDLYNYIGNTTLYDTEEQKLESIKADINDDFNINDYVRAMQNIIDNMEENDEQLNEAKEVLQLLENKIPRYEYHLGDTVYIGADEYEILSISDDKVRLYDTKFPLFNKEMDRAEFDTKVKENYANDHLKVENKVTSIEEKSVETLEQILYDFANSYDIYALNEVPIEQIREDLKNSDSIQKNIQYLKEILKQEDEENDFTKDLKNVISELEKLFEKRIKEQKLKIEIKDENVEILEKEEQENNIIIPNFEKQRTNKIQSYDLHPEIKQEDRLNYQIQNDDLGMGTPREKFRRNIEAIKVLKLCEDENRYATQEEQEILSQYIGWGGMPEAFEENNNSWKSEYLELKSLLTDEEYKQARASTLTAFYTPPVVIRSIYKALDNMGLKDGNILEPSCGVGNFLGMLPQTLEKCKMYGIELDSVTGRIAQQLYQKSNIAVNGYERVELPDSFFDVAVGNVPFGDFKVIDRRYDKNKFQIHDYFFAKTLDKVRPGGIIAFITSKGTMDKQNPTVRKYIAQRADLLGAIRLPDNTFTKNAGTRVTSDIIFLQKRENMTDIMPDWVYLDTNSDGITMNKYFVDNPEMVLGNMVMESTAHGQDSACKAHENIELSNLLDYAVSNIYGEIEEYSIDDIDEDEKSIAADPNVKNFSYCLVDGQVYFRENSKMFLQELPVTTTNRIRGMIELRDSVSKLIELQTEDSPDNEIKAERQRLNILYDNFVKKYGLINSRGNNLAFSDDSSYYLLCSLEVLDSNGRFVRKADMFNRRTIKAYKEITSVNTANEALILSLSEKARVDLEYMSKLSNKTQEELTTELKGAIYKLPLEDDKYVTADEYLSGNIREKLKLAEKIAETNPEFQEHVEALTKVMPEYLKASEIAVKLGATWLPTEVIDQFMYELLDTPNYAQWKIKARYSEHTAEWYIKEKNYDYSNVKANKTYGTNRINAYKIIEQTLNLKDVKIFDTIENEYGEKERVLNRQETAIAQAKQEQIKTEFEEWIWKDQQRREELEKLYNEKFNSIRPREYDGSHLNFVGMNPEITLRKHQQNAIAHILYGRNTLLAHEVRCRKNF